MQNFSKLKPFNRGLGALLLLPLLALCSTACRTGELLYEPHTTPAAWCKLRPCVDMGGFIFNEPLGSFLVFLLAALWVLSGVHFLKGHRDQISRKWFGISLVLGGIGAAQAGISYQAFSHLLKCQGREFCLLTNAFEIGYSVTQAVSVSAMLTAVAFACTRGVFKKVVIAYCVVNVVVYLVVTFIGVTAPSRLLLSFEVLMLFALPGLLFVILISGVSYIRTRQPLDGSLLTASLLFVVVQAAYFGYYAAGITAVLYKEGQGFYFSENDVLHVGMIFWLLYIVLVVGKHLQDHPATKKN